MGARMHADLSDLTSDLRKIAVTSKRDMRRTVAKNVRDGNKAGKRIARSNSGTHARRYPASWSAEMTGPLRGEWGADFEDRANQGFLAEVLEHGGRRSPGHHDLAKSADLQVPKFLDDAAKLPDDWFWPGAK